MTDINELCRLVIGAAMRVHTYFGPGFLEEVYKNALMVELHQLGIRAEKEVAINVVYQGTCVGNYQADIIVDGILILELKAVASLVVRHEAQLVNYLAATLIEDGLLLNFGAQSLQVKHKYRTYKPRRDLIHKTNRLE